MDQPTLKNLTSQNYGIPPEAQNQVRVLIIAYLLSKCINNSCLQKAHYGLMFVIVFKKTGRAPYS